MFTDIIGYILKQLDSLGLSGLIIGILLFAVIKLWAELQAERGRCEDVSDKLHAMAVETAIMIERITGK